MRRLTALIAAAVVISVGGCGRLRTGQQPEGSAIAGLQQGKGSKPTTTFSKAQGEPRAPTAESLMSASPKRPSPAPATSSPTLTSRETVPKATTASSTTTTPPPAGDAGAQKEATPPWAPADDARSLRAALDSLRSQFDRLPPEEVRVRLLLVQHGLSELEAQLPALVLWRTALRLETLSKTATPDVTLAQAWLQRVRPWLVRAQVGLTAWEAAMNALKANHWTDAVNALREAANRLRANEQLEALTQARASLINASEAMERHKLGVAKAEVEEGMRAIDRLLPLLSP